MDEIWRDINGFEGEYEVSNLGRVKSSVKGKPRILKAGKTSVGYPSVVLRRGNTKLVHVLVAEAFIGPRPRGCDVMHLDGSRDNNVATNLKYGTRSENNLQVVKDGRRKLNVHEVNEIRMSTGKISVLAKKYGCSESHISSIRNGRYYVDSFN